MKAKRKSDGAIIDVESIDACLVKNSIPFALYYTDERQTIYCETELDLIFPLSESEEEVTIEGQVERGVDGLPRLCTGYISYLVLPRDITIEGEVTITIKPKKKSSTK